MFCRYLENVMCRLGCRYKKTLAEKKEKDNLGETIGAGMKDNTTRQALAQRDLELNKIDNEKLLKKPKAYKRSCEKRFIES